MLTYLLIPDNVVNLYCRGEVIANMCPESHQKMISNIRKTQEKSKNKKQSKDDDDDEEEEEMTAKEPKK